jgi:hypothetical protein
MRALILVAGAALVISGCDDGDRFEQPNNVVINEPDGPTDHCGRPIDPDAPPQDEVPC